MDLVDCTCDMFSMVYRCERYHGPGNLFVYLQNQYNDIYDENITYNQ